MILCWFSQLSSSISRDLTSAIVSSLIDFLQLNLLLTWSANVQQGGRGCIKNMLDKVLGFAAFFPFAHVVQLMFSKKMYVSVDV